MAVEVEVPVRRRALWLAFTDPERMARAVPGLTVDAVQAVPAAVGLEGVAGDVIAGRLKLKVGGGATITYRGTGCIAAADAHDGTLDIAVDVAQARGNGAVAGYLRIALSAAGESRTLVSIVPELEMSGRAVEFKTEDWHEAASALAEAWLTALAADFLEAGDLSGASNAVAQVQSEALETEAPNEASEAVVTAEIVESAGASAVVAAASPEPSEKSSNPEPEIYQDSLSGDPLEPVWRGEYERNPWPPAIIALTLFLLIIRRRRRRDAR